MLPKSDVDLGGSRSPPKDSMLAREQFYIELGARLRSKREASGLTQADVAEVAGISRTSLTNIEGGRQRILVDQLALICAKLGMKTSEVIPEEAPAAAPSKDRLSEMPVVASFLQSVADRGAR